MILVLKVIFLSKGSFEFSKELTSSNCSWNKNIHFYFPENLNSIFWYCIFRYKSLASPRIWVTIFIFSKLNFNPWISYDFDWQIELGKKAGQDCFRFCPENCQKYLSFPCEKQVWMNSIQLSSNLSSSAMEGREILEWSRSLFAWFSRHWIFEKVEDCFP